MKLYSPMMEFDWKKGSFWNDRKKEKDAVL